MKKTYPDSRIEIWNANYINRLLKRMDEDENVIIIQCEAGCGNNNYIVEVIDKEAY